MKKFIGNCSTINWEKLVTDLKNNQPLYEGPRHIDLENEYLNNTVGSREIANLWRNAGYKLKSKGGTAGWDMFVVSEDIKNAFEDFVKIKCKSCWVSSIHPGCFAPWHWDTQDKEEELRNGPEILRFHCHMEDTKPGHIIIVEDEIYYNANQGDVYQWPSRISWHAGSNCGLERKFIFNFFGEKK
jgi:hypothetical protein